MQSYYEINVSHHGQHLFATAERSCVTKDSFDSLLELLKAKFPEKEGFSIDGTYWETIGHKMEKETVDASVYQATRVY